LLLKPDLEADTLTRAPKITQEELDASFAKLTEQLLLALQRQTDSDTDASRLLNSCGLGWGLHRLLSNQSLLEIARRSAAYKPMLALLSFLARSDQHSPERKHLHAALLVAPLQPKGWVGVKLPLSAAESTANAVTSSANDAKIAVAVPARRSQV